MLAENQDDIDIASSYTYNTNELMQMLNVSVNVASLIAIFRSAIDTRNDSAIITTDI